MQEKSKTDEKGKESEHIVINFKCVSCSLCEKVHYKGKNPPFSRNIELKYPSYIMKDPFSPPGKGEILVLGADCSICERSVCIGKDCSLFYSKLYCLDCVKINMDKFPAEIRSKVQIKSKK